MASEPIVITLQGNCPIKKNAAGKLWFRTDPKTKAKIPLKFPIIYYQDNYTKWAKEAVQHLIAWKQKCPVRFPLSGSYFVSFWIWRDTKNVLEESKGKIDLSNLIEAPQDVLAGSAGSFLDTKGHKFDHSLYQIFSDDNVNIITSLGTSKTFYTPVNPHTDIFISPFSLDKFAKVHKYIHSLDPPPEIDDVPLDLFGQKKLQG